MYTVYSAVALAAVVAGSALPLLLWIGPALLGQPLLRLYLLAEHTGCAESPDMLENSRTTRTNALVRYVAWNMPFHAEHHAYPSVPFHALPALHRLVADALGCRGNGYLAVERGILTNLGDSRQRPEKSALAGAGAGDAERRGRVELQALQPDVLAAAGAEAVVAARDPAQRGIDPVELELAAALGRDRHRLRLQLVHARQSAGPGLVELDRARLVAMARGQLLELQPPRLEPGDGLGEIGWMSVGHGATIGQRNGFVAMQLVGLCRTSRSSADRAGVPLTRSAIFA